MNLATGANALAIRATIRATIDRLAPLFSPELEAVSLYNTTPFVEVSIADVVNYRSPRPSCSSSSSCSCRSSS